MPNRYQRESPDAVRPSTAWRRATFHERAWRFLTGITMADSSTVVSPTMTDDTVADLKRAARGLTPGERPLPPYPFDRWQPPLSHRVWLRKFFRKMATEHIELVELAAGAYRRLGFEREARQKEHEALALQRGFDREWRR